MKSSQYVYTFKKNLSSNCFVLQLGGGVNNLTGGQLKLQVFFTCSPRVTKYGGGIFTDWCSTANVHYVSRSRCQHYGRGGDNKEDFLFWVNLKDVENSLKIKMFNLNKTYYSNFQLIILVIRTSMFNVYSANSKCFFWPQVNFDLK